MDEEQLCARTSPESKCWRTVWRALLYIDPRQPRCWTWGSRGPCMIQRQDSWAMSSMYISSHCFSVRAGTYDVIDGMFHQKSLLCEFTEKVAEGIGRYTSYCNPDPVPHYTQSCVLHAAFLVTCELHAIAIIVILSLLQTMAGVLKQRFNGTKLQNMCLYFALHMFPTLQCIACKHKPPNHQLWHAEIR